MQEKSRISNKNKMNKDITELEKIEQEISDKGIELIHYPFKSKRLKGLYLTRKDSKYICLNDQITSQNEKVCILTEELAHDEVSEGNISSNTKAENFARFKSYDKLIGLDGLVKAYKNNCESIYEIAEFLEVTYDFLIESINAYEKRYGVSTKYKNYIITFKPYLTISEH